MLSGLSLLLGSPQGPPPSDVRLLQALHSLHVALRLLQDLLGQFLWIQLSGRSWSLLLGLHRAVCLSAGLVRLRATDLPFPSSLSGAEGQK